jgi:ABC-type oligopeptide transport system substrate-binding subunit/class 3 adenylate cyclase
VQTAATAADEELITPAEGSPGSAAVQRAIQRFVPGDLAERLLTARGPLGRERRMMTILFSDVKGSTAMAESLDPEDLMEIMDGAFEVLISPIYRYEGTLARLMGDGILAFFGAPIAHEDDAQRACLAGLEIVAGAQRYAEKLEQERGIRGFAVRVGINTGLVVVGEVGSDLRVEYTAMGDAVNLAARLEAAAEPGTVLVSEATHKLVAPLFVTEALGSIEVKGRLEPVSVYRVTSTRAEVGKLRGITGLASSIVGREAECAALQDALARLQAGAGGVATVVGEAGIGKSRLVAEVRKGAASAPLQWVEGRCLSYGTSITYLLWLDVLRDLLGVTLDDGPGKVAAVLQARVAALCPEHFDAVFPYLGRLMSLPLGDEVEALLADLDGRTLRERTFAAVETLLACVAEEQPLAVVCEDLHWADPTSIALLEGLLPLTKRAPLLVVCVFRPEKRHRSWRLQEITARDHGERHTHLWLEALSRDESARLVGNLLRLEGLPSQLKEQIQERAEGNPFYLEEVLRSLIDEGAIEQEAGTGRWLVTGEVEEIAIPDTLQGVLLARIDRLQEETKRVLQMAAVIGRLFLYRVLAAIAVEERDLDGRLLTLRQEEMIRERARLPELEYIFKHHLTQEAAYNGLLKKERRVFHRQVAEALERLFPERVEAQVGLLAHHWERAGDAEKATAYLLQAGDQARLAYAQEEAIDFYERALVFLGEMGEDDRAARTQMKLGLTYDSVFDFQRSREAYEAGFALWQRAGSARRGRRLARAPHALRLYLDEPEGLDYDHLDVDLIYQLFSGLADDTPEFSVVPDVAASWDLLDGGRRYVFHLRDDVYWSDGVPVTAHDFEFAWKRLLDPAASLEDAGLLYDIRGARDFHEAQGRDLGVRALDEATLEVELEGPTGYFLHVISYPATYPVPRHVVEGRGPAAADPDGLVTNGPFTIASWHPGKSLVLERYPRYHGPVSGNVHEVQLTFLQPDARHAPMEKYQAGSSDVIQFGGSHIGIKTMDRLRQSHAAEWVSLPSATTGVLVFDASRPPFDDARVRRAFALALDRGKLVNEFWGAYWFEATGGFVPPGMPGHVPGIALPYDPERAQQLLAEAGYPHGAGFPTVEMWVGLPADPEYWEHPVVGQWNRILNVSARMRWQDFRSAANAGRVRDLPPHIYFTGWAGDYPDPDSYLRVAVQFYSTWQHEQYLDIIERARRTLDQAQRMALYAQAERILAEEVPILPVDYDRKHFLIKPWVRRYPRSPNGTLFWKDVVIEPH